VIYTINLFTPFDNSLLHQAFTNTLSVINIPANNGGFTFKNNEYTWWLNGVEDTQKRGVLYISDPILVDKYNVEVTILTAPASSGLIAGEKIGVCPVTIARKAPVKLKVYPNPTDGELRIENYELRITNYELGNGSQVEVFNMKGKRVHVAKPQFIIPNSQFLINISHLPNGMYIVRYNGQTATIVKK
jgi:hypothetical protein